jgi:hypothetical protein
VASGSEPQPQPPPGGFGGAPPPLGSAPFEDAPVAHHARTSSPWLALGVGVAVLGVLVGLAVLAVRKRIVAVRIAEGMNGVGEIAKAAVMQRQQSGSDEFCPSATAPVPTFLPQQGRRKFTARNLPGQDYRTDSERNAGFACIGWEMKDERRGDEDRRARSRLGPRDECERSRGDDGMKRMALLVMLAACANQAPKSTSTPTSTPTSTSTPTPTATATSTPTADASPRLERCSAKQVNVPCVMKLSAGCFVRRSNCTGLPCTESAPEPVSCSLYESGAPPNACAIHAKCFGQYKEGCTLGPRENKLQLVIPPACANAVLRAATCPEVEALMGKPMCR